MENFGNPNKSPVNPESAKIKTSEKHYLYPERVSDSFERVIQDIQKIESNESLKQELTNFEKQELFEYEGQFADRLESIFAMNVQTSTLYPDYFLTEAGKGLWQEVLGESIPDNLKNPQDFFYEQTEKLAALKKEQRTKISYASRMYSEEKTKSELLQRMDEFNHFSVEGIESVEAMKLLLNPSQAAIKNKELRELKKEIKETAKSLQSNEGNLSAAKKTLLSMYLKRINELIAAGQINAKAIQKKLSTIGTESMSSDELEILKAYSLIKNENSESHTSRMDKFKFGASKEYGEDGYRKQVSKELLKYAQNIDIERELIEANKDRLIAEKGIDKEKIEAMNITPAERKEWGDRILDAYGLLSSNVSEDDSGNADPLDQGWRYLNKERGSMAINSKKRIVYDTQKISKVSHTFPVALAHEIEGHVLQHVNKKTIPLRLFQTVGGGRNIVFSEGGAMHNQNMVSKKLFGYESLPNPHYVRAMATRLNGGNYAECVKSFYESAINSARQKFKEGEINKTEFDAQSEGRLDLAIRSTKRLFRNGEPNSTSSFLANSKDTAYLEQKKFLMD